ncbi:terminase small subunit [Sphingomonas montanisoli]|uniref:Terminase small subunit n=1 Tax=Sphingomonas montanisoli TaxID=2606412 RepID=A0A5D9C1J1_9SPHN|nr:terminase small subunit [Sphingomonas montanisoli]TZG25594.1 terminase small subunit [Sphingomonas montanisoli]
MTPKQQRFVEEYLIDLNATQAAIRAGYSARTADRIGPELLGKTCVADAITEGRARLSEKAEITQEMVLRRWWDIATADPNDLIQFRRTCCRHCHGVDHAYQWIDPEEFATALSAVAAGEASELPTDDGGYGYDRRADPHADCPKCFGEGQAHIHGLDTRKLKGGARLLYAGVKQTRDGFEIKMQDQGKALENVARHLGMFVDKVEHSNPDGSLAPKTIIIKAAG